MTFIEGGRGVKAIFEDLTGYVLYQGSQGSQQSLVTVLTFMFLYFDGTPNQCYFLELQCQSSKFLFFDLFLHITFMIPNHIIIIGQTQSKNMHILTNETLSYIFLVLEKLWSQDRPQVLCSQSQLRSNLLETGEYMKNE